MQALPQNVDAWLTYIESLHPKSIEMGLARVSQVLQRLSLNLTGRVITVGGTNGKGSTCAMLERIYTQAGYSVACYTSPHLLHYHERVRLNGDMIGDADLCAAFNAVEQARGDIHLTYFEMGTLSALWYFAQHAPDVIILEVGLGGRLDAVNIVDADCAIVTNVDMDHMEFLGDTREKIAKEKAGIYRANQISIFGDTHPPNTLVDYAQELGTELSCFGREFKLTDVNGKHVYQDAQGVYEMPELGMFGAYQYQNAAAVLCAVRLLQSLLPVSTEVVSNALKQIRVHGRFQTVRDHPTVILDVGHNPHAARALLANIQAIKSQDIRCIAVFSMLADKDIRGVVGVLKTVVDEWHIAPISHPRAADANTMARIIQDEIPNARLTIYTDIENALQVAYETASKNDKIIVFGSFFTVAAVMLDT